MRCGKCGSLKNVKNGKRKGVQCYKCKGCGHQTTVEGVIPTNLTDEEAEGALQLAELLWEKAGQAIERIDSSRLRPLAIVRLIDASIRLRQMTDAGQKGRDNPNDVSPIWLNWFFDKISDKLD